LEKQRDRVLSAVCEQALAQGGFSAVGAGVSLPAAEDHPLSFFYGGKTRGDPTGIPVDESTFFDLASLTKPLCTALVVGTLVDEGLISWDTPCLPLLGVKTGDEKKYITVRHLLQHVAGFPAYVPYYRGFPALPGADGSKSILRLILDEPLIAFPDTACLYSDLGFILLGACIEAVTGKGLDTLFRERITDPLDLTGQLFFLSSNSRKKPVDNVAATEDCPWRGRVLQGEVHDEHCWLMNGVAGHAGLFGTVGGVQTLCTWLLDRWQGRVVCPILSRETVCRILTTRHPHGAWRLGFDTPTPPSSSGRYFSPTSVGHLGFTGTSFWIDPVHDCSVVLLTNRIHPSRDNTFLKEFRPFFHDRLMERICTSDEKKKPLP
jgi:CubicO group peptidase (beta-lactamase class C family)